MNSQAVRDIARAILYEGYMLYPYRRSAMKNRQRWSFGVLYPPAWIGPRRNVEAFDTAGLRRTAGIVEQAIDAAEFLDRLADQRAHLLLDGHIGLAEHTIGAELFRKPLALRRAPSGDDDAGAFGHENLRGV